MSLTDPITLQDVTMFSPDEKSDLMTSSESESEDEQADYREDNMLSPRVAFYVSIYFPLVCIFSLNLLVFRWNESYRVL